MSLPASILVYGRDPQLLKTRCWVLKSAGYSVRVAAKLSDIVPTAAGEGVDLLILCHTLSMEERGRAIAVACARWPHVQTLVLTVGQTNWHFEMSSHLADSNEGPEKLLEAIATLVASPNEFECAGNPGGPRRSVRSSEQRVRVA